MRNLITLLYIFLLPALLVGQGNQTAGALKEQPINRGLEATIDKLFGATNNPTSPGCAVTVHQDGKIIAKKDYGMASLELKVPFTHQTVVRMPYSEAREFIAIAAVLMEQDGVLKLDEPVRKYFPKLPEWSRTVTVWDLLNHRSGFVDEWSEMMLTQASMANRLDLSEFLNLLYKQPAPSVEPGKGYMYSNSDFGLLRLILEKASGKNLADWLKQRVFDPLEMNSTRMQNNPLDVIPNGAIVYTPVGNKKYLMQSVQKTSPGANYFILTNADDLERWAAAHSDNSTDVAKATHRLLANVRNLPGTENHFVFGHSYRKINEQAVVFHEGVNGFNYLTRIPAKGLSIITFGNLSGGFAAENKSIVDYLLMTPNQSQTPQPQSQFLTRPISISKQELQQYAGRYVWQNQTSFDSYLPVRKTSDFFVDGDTLKCSNCATDASLLPVGKDLFYFKDKDGIGFQFEFSKAALNAPMRAEVRFSDGYPSIKLQKESGEIWQPSKQELSRFTGKYYSKHLDFYWTLELNEGGKLVIKRPTIADTIIEPDGLNQFRFTIDKGPGGGFDAWMLFHQDEKRRITHFTVWHPRMMHHRFDKLEP
jgi:CubicO group peptidase (beta-lactamase class C family)